MTKIAIALLTLLTLSCGIPDMFKTQHETKETTATPEQIRSTLERRGYTIDTSSETMVVTKWRSIRFYPGTPLETWFSWRIGVYFSGNKMTVDCWCLQQRTTSLYRRWSWKRCTDPDILSLVNVDI